MVIPRQIGQVYPLPTWGDNVAIVPIQGLWETHLTVGDLDRSIAFYRDAIGLKELRREDYPTGGFTLAFLDTVG